jgi:hypothetical protein
MYWKICVVAAQPKLEIKGRTSHLYLVQGLKVDLSDNYKYQM